MQLGRNCGMLCLRKQEWKEHCPLLSDMLSYIPKVFTATYFNKLFESLHPQNQNVGQGVGVASQTYLVLNVTSSTAL